MAEEAKTSERTFPPATFETLIGFFVQQAYMGLGTIRNPDTDEPLIDLPFAKHMIDLLGVIEEKTRGNLTAPERNYMENTLYSLRMTYVRVKENPPRSEKRKQAETMAAAHDSTAAEPTAADPPPKDEDDA